MSNKIDAVALSSGISLLALSTGGVVAPPIRVQYTGIAQPQTPLPEGLRPPSLLASGTGSLLLTKRFFHQPSELERTAEGSLELIKAVAAAVPIDKDDEAIVDAAVAKSLARLETRPLRRRAGSNG